MAAAVEVSLAGCVAVGSAGQGGPAALGSRARIALAYLAMERWRPVARDELAEVVWGAELPPTWRAALRGVVSRVRGALSAAGLDPGTALTSGPGGYQLHLPLGSTVDVEVAQENLGVGRATLKFDPRQALFAFERAVSTLRGEFLAGADGPWVKRRQAEFAELYLQALELLSQARGRCDDADGALQAAEEAVALQPLRESAHLCAMAAHEMAGNRGRALRAYERCRRLLADELGVAPGPELGGAYALLLGEEPAVRAAAPKSRSRNLPISVTSFVGRVGERAEIRALLGATRVLTMTGGGGAGKSRLALEVAVDVADEYPHGVWLVELAGVGEARLLPAQVQSVLQVADLHGCSALDSLVAHLEDKRLLLVLDNCEHLVSPCASLADRLLQSCPGVKIMATSREPLGVGGETLWVIPPLSSPGPDDGGSLESLLRYDAAALFVERAVSADLGLDLADMGDAVVTICRRLDGNPLALELAAARVRSMAVPEIAERLRDRFGLLVTGVRTAPARHQTLRAALDWSYESLSALESRLFACLSVFSSSFTIIATEAVCPDGPATALETLTRLVDKSLVLADKSERQGRYRLLETTRQYGYEKLVETGLEADARRAQLRWSAAVAEAAEVGLEGPEQSEWLLQLDREYDNIGGALEWAAGHPEDPHGQRTAAALWRYWEMRGFLSEGRSRLESMLAADAPASLRAKAMNSAGVLAQGQGDHGAAWKFYTQALDIRRTLGDRLGMTAALNGLGNVAVGQDDLFAARAIFEQNLATSREIGDARVIAASLMNLGVVAQLLFVSGRIDRFEGASRAHAFYVESFDLYRGLGDTRGMSQALENLGAIAPYLGDDARATDCLEESLVLRREMKDRSGIAAAARFLGHLALKRGEYDAARSLHEECFAIECDIGNVLLMTADLASLAEIALGEGNQVEAKRLGALAKGLSHHVGEAGVGGRLRVNVGQVGSDTGPSTPANAG